MTIERGKEAIILSGGHESHAFVREDAVPQWSLEDLRLATINDAMRLDGLKELLIQKGVISQEEYTASIERSIQTRYQHVIERLSTQVVDVEVEDKG